MPRSYDDDAVVAPIYNHRSGRSEVRYFHIEDTSEQERADVARLTNYIGNYRRGTYGHAGSREANREFQYKLGSLSGATIGGWPLETDFDEIAVLIAEGELDYDDIYDDTTRYNS